MSITSALVLFVVIWFLTFLVVIPIRLKTQGDVGEIVPGTMAGSPHVVDVIHLRTQHFGPDQLLVGAKVVFESHLTFEELANAINEVERRVREVVPIARPMYIEPDIVRETVAPAPPDDHHD